MVQSEANPYVHIKHRCPTCERPCYPPRKHPTGNPNGRPPSSQDKLIEILRNEASRARPLSTQDLANRLGLAPISVTTLIYRTRKSRKKVSYEIVHLLGRGYYLRLAP